MVIAMFAMHGVLYLWLKTEGDLSVYVQGLAKYAAGIFAVLYVAVTVYTLVAIPHARPRFMGWFLAPLNVLALIGVFTAINRSRPGVHV